MAKVADFLPSQACLSISPIIGTQLDGGLLRNSARQTPGVTLHDRQEYRTMIGPAKVDLQRKFSVDGAPLPLFPVLTHSFYSFSPLTKHPLIVSDRAHNLITLGPIKCVL